MDNWFTVNRIDPRTFAISEWGHWEEVHAYLLNGSDRAALIDSGLGVGSIKRVVDELTERPTIVLTTHAHWDHIGGHGQFASVAVHPGDEAWLRFGLPVCDEQIRQTLMAEPFRQRTRRSLTRIIGIHSEALLPRRLSMPDPWVGRA